MEEIRCGICGKKFEGYSKEHVTFQLQQHAGSKKCKPKEEDEEQNGNESRQTETKPEGS